MSPKSNPKPNGGRLRTTIELSDNFSQSCLPQTMGIATDYQPVILPYLPEVVGKWSYHDRVLCWLVPSLEPDITRFYVSQGPDILSMFKSRQLDYIDEDLSQMLVQRINSIVADLRRDRLAKPKAFNAYLFRDASIDRKR